jgi:RimJ/RimL family protein N-acetyltransferase
MVQLYGTQIVLRDWQIADLEAFACWMAPGHEWQALDGPYYPVPDSDEILAMVAKKRAQIETGELPTPRQNLAIAGIRTDELMGHVNWYWQSQETNWLSLGIGIYNPNHWRRGIGYEALGLWSDYLWCALPAIVRLDLRTWSGNRGMMRLAEKLGYKEEACFRRARIVNGVYYDALGYGVLREEWQERYPDGFAAHLALPV